MHSHCSLFGRGVLIAGLALSVAGSDAAAQNTSDPVAPEPPAEYLLEIQREARIKGLGEHWSGLDRWALFLELEAENRTAAAARLDVAARASERPGALWNILSELASTDAFEPVRIQVAAVAREMAARRQPADVRRVRRDPVAQDEELAFAQLLEDFLGDRAAARACYERVLGDELARRVREGRENLDAGGGLSDRERGAARRLADLTILARPAGEEGDPQ